MSNNNQNLYSSRIDLSTEIRSKVISSLSQTLSTSIDLKTQFKQAHWNVKGLNFYQLHQLFDEIATEIEEFIDLVAERITALGGTAYGTARIAAQESILEEYPLEIVAGPDHIIALADRLGVYAKLVRNQIEITNQLADADTADLYTEISRTVDKRLWFLEAHLV